VSKIRADIKEPGSERSVINRQQKPTKRCNLFVGQLAKSDTSKRIAVGVLSF
jgi:hypothetical protein